MVKSFLSTALVLLASSVALAYPAVNDSATYQGTYAQTGGTTPVQLVSTLKQFNAQTGQFLLNETQTLGEQTQTQDSWVNQADLVSQAQVQNVLLNCQAHGGTLETLNTPAGAFNTCRLQQQAADGSDQIYWFADVPFGLAQYQVSGVNQGQAYQINLTLTAFVNGQ